MARPVGMRSMLRGSLTPFLYPCLDSSWARAQHGGECGMRLARSRRRILNRCGRRQHSTTGSREDGRISHDVLASRPPVDVNQFDHLNPQVPEYSTQPFTDSCSITLHAGSGGHGCISFLREKYIANGPANGGDGGTGGNIYIQAVRGETSLHKLARRGILKAGRGKNGQGSLKGGSRGEDVLVTVPVGTVVREVWRKDPVEEEIQLDREERRSKRRSKGFGRDLEDDENNSDSAQDTSRSWRRDRWLLYPGALPKYFTSADFPALPRPRKSNIAMGQPPAPVQLDLDKPMSTPMLLAAGSMGGLGNPHFVTKSIPRPKYATKGDAGMSMHLQLELKLLADVGLVGLPNAGKSTLLRALTSSRTRIGDWAFTTLSPNIGTVVLDDYKTRPLLATQGGRQEQRANFTIADIPGLIEGAHQDRGLGLGFLRHIERAAVLCFVVDLSAGDAATNLRSLWTEVGEYEKLRERELNAETERKAGHVGDAVPLETSTGPVVGGFAELERASNAQGRDTSSLLVPEQGKALPILSLPPISSKAWFVVATKADLPGTQENFANLQAYLSRVETGQELHPSGKKNAWRKRLVSQPVSAMKKEGVQGIPEIVLDLLEG